MTDSTIAVTKRLVIPPKLPVSPAAPTAEPVTPKNAIDAGEYIDGTSESGVCAGVETGMVAGDEACDDTEAIGLGWLAAADSSRQSVAVFMCKVRSA